MKHRNQSQSMVNLGKERVNTPGKSNEQINKEPKKFKLNLKKFSHLILTSEKQPIGRIMENNSRISEKQSKNYGMNNLSGPMRKIIIERTFAPKLQEFCVETTSSKAKKRHQHIKDKFSVDQKLNLIINEQVTGSPLIDDLYHQYQQKNFQINLHELREKIKQMKNTNDEILDLRCAKLKHIEWKDDDQINFFISQIQHSSNVSVKKILNIQNYDNKEEFNKVDEKELQEQMKTLITKRINNQELDEVIDDEEEKQRKKLIEIYHETRLDQIEPEFKNLTKMNLLTVNKMNKAMENQFSKVEYNGSGQKQQFRPKSAFRNSQKFQKYWNVKSKVVSAFMEQDMNAFSDQQTDVCSGPLRNNFNQSITNKSQEFFSQAKEANNTQRTLFFERQRNFSETFLRPQTATPTLHQSVGRKKVIKKASGVQKLIKECKSIERQNRQKSGKLMAKIDQIDDDLEKTLKMITAVQEQQTQEHQEMDEQFTRYKNQARFRRKFVSYLVDNLKNKNDILGRQSLEPKQNNFLQDRLSQN